jgi:Ser/Thr protein kinase RdoA (MazF antagonist)
VNHADTAAPPTDVVTAFDLVEGSLRRVETGLINQTWYANDARSLPCILQRVNPVFPADVNTDIDVVTRHLRAKGLESPVLGRCRTGKLWFEHRGEVWRTLSYVDGESHDALQSTAQAFEAGRMLATFHRALADLDHTFRNARLGVHDTPKHLQELRVTLAEHGDHPQYARIALLGAEVLDLAATIAPLPQTSDRIVHGDPKISNVMFTRGGGRALCLIDLDTLARMPIAFELGDAFRSWCNPKTEDASSSTFSMPLFSAALDGYANGSSGLLQPLEWQSIAAATFTIAVELAARFCADALRERYFRWDPDRYANASEHNQARTRGQLNLALTIRAQRTEIDAAIERAFA